MGTAPTRTDGHKLCELKISPPPRKEFGKCSAWGRESERVMRSEGGGGTFFFVSFPLLYATGAKLTDDKRRREVNYCCWRRCHTHHLLPMHNFENKGRLSHVGRETVGAITTSSGVFKTLLLSVTHIFPSNGAFLKLWLGGIFLEVSAKFYWQCHLI